jgi:hypothetical protein
MLPAHRETNDDELLRLATLVNRDLSAPEAAALKSDIAALDHEETALVMLASKLLAGEPHGVETNSADSLRRCRSFAEGMGATVLALGTSPEGAGRMTVLFGPPPRQ